jgi:predicted amidophosphoribosyltransferase
MKITTELLDIGICKECRVLLPIEVFQVKRGEVKVFAGSRYSPVMANLILSAKESNQLQARKYLADCLARSLIRAIAVHSKQRKSANLEIILIPIPSRKAANRTRGLEHVDLLLKLLIKNRNSSNLKPLNCLQHRKRVSDQATLNFKEREINMRGAFKINTRFSGLVDEIGENQIKAGETRVGETLVFLVDDLVTTGSTVQAATLALNGRGVRVDGTLASCATDGFTH